MRAYIVVPALYVMRYHGIQLKAASVCAAKIAVLTDSVMRATLIRDDVGHAGDLCTPLLFVEHTKSDTRVSLYFFLVISFAKINFDISSRLETFFISSCPSLITARYHLLAQQAALLLGSL